MGPYSRVVQKSRNDKFDLKILPKFSSYGNESPKIFHFLKKTCIFWIKFKIATTWYDTKLRISQAFSRRKVKKIFSTICKSSDPDRPMGFSKMCPFHFKKGGNFSRETNNLLDVKRAPKV